MKKALMIIAMVAIVAIAGSMIYYFGFFKPNLEQKKFDYDKQQTLENKQALEAGFKKAKENYLIMIFAIQKESKPMEQYKIEMQMAKDLYQIEIDNLYKQYGD